MRNYGIEVSAQPRAIKDEFIYRTRQQAFNKLLGWGIGLLSIAITVDLAIYLKADMILFPIPEFIAVAFAFVKFAIALVEYTNEDRQILNDMYSVPIIEQEHYQEERQKTSNEQSTIIPQPKGNGHFIIHVGLTSTQLQSIANAMLNSNTLTVNYLESLRISRQNAERIRNELAEYHLLEYDKKGRVTLTKDGELVCNRILSR